MVIAQGRIYVAKRRLSALPMAASSLLSVDTTVPVKQSPTVTNY